MDSANTFTIVNSKIELTVAEQNASNLTQPELATEAILALLNCLDVKQFDAVGVRGKFDTYLERITEAVHAVGERSGWQDHL